MNLPDITETFITPALLGCLVILLITLAVGLARALRGPSLADSLTSILLLGTGGVASLFLLALLLSAPALLDVALLLALLAAVAAAAITRRETGND
jgi:multicomponent Na+:H+ antiporter subunit F